jgi:hypothetical protein
MRRILITLGLTAVTLAATATAALGHYQIDDRRWWFGGNTYGEANAQNKTDPVNMLFYPGYTTKEFLDAHFNDHWGPGDPDEWIEQEHLPDTPSPAQCRGDQWVRFREDRGTGGWQNVPTDFHGAGVGRTEGRCFNRFHIRFWGDARHEQFTNTTHPEKDAWIVGGAHYEENFTEDDEPGHIPAMDWDAVEERIVQVMRPHSATLRWKCLPNSFGMYQRFRSDGRITRLSRRHGRQTQTTATEENGQC